jgi:hypothetical protein
MNDQDTYTPDEWRTLQLAPFWMLSAVVGAYRRVDPRDYQVFVRCLEAAALAEGRLRQAVLASVLADPDRLAEQFRREPRSIGVGLFQVDAILRKADPEEADRFKDMLLLDIGEGVARARGRYGTEMSEDGAKALVLAAQLLAFDRYPAEA